MRIIYPEGVPDVDRERISVVLEATVGRTLVVVPSVESDSEPPPDPSARISTRTWRCSLFDSDGQQSWVVTEGEP